MGPFHKLSLPKMHIFMVLSLLTAFYGLLSWPIISAYNPLGSNETLLFISKMPSVVNWDEVKDTPYEMESLLPQDSFLNYSDQASGELIVNQKTRPSIYIRGEESIYPIFMHNRVGALPHILVRALANLTTPALGVSLYIWLCSLVTFGAALLFIHARGASVFGFILTALTSMQFYSFAEVSFPDISTIVAVYAVLFYLFERCHSKRSFYFIGFLLGLTLYIKISSLILLPLFALFYFKKIKRYKWQLLLGASFWLALLIWAFDYKGIAAITAQRHSKKNFEDVFNMIGYAWLFVVEPAAPFKVLIDEISSQASFYTQRSFLFFLEGILIIPLIAYFLGKGLKRLDKYRVFFLISLYLIAAIAIAKEIDEDYMAYLSQGFLIFVIFIFSRLKFDAPLKIWPLSLFFILRTVALIEWGSILWDIKKDLPGCLTPHECMAQDWSKDESIKRLPFLTDYYLDVGQVEFFTSEKITPIHLTRKLDNSFDLRKRYYFFKNFPYNEFYILIGREFNPIETRVNFEKVNFHLDVVKTYPFLKLGTTYNLIKLSRMKNHE